VIRPAILAPRARRDPRYALRRIDRSNVAAARGLNDAVELAAHRLGANPGLGSTRPHLPGRFRVCSLTRYAYLLVYDPNTTPVQVLRIVYMRRHLPVLLADLRDAPTTPKH
jgi:toxin ParE1/3/4